MLTTELLDSLVNPHPLPNRRNRIAAFQPVMDRGPHKSPSGEAGYSVLVVREVRENDGEWYADELVASFVQPATGFVGISEYFPATEAGKVAAIKAYDRTAGR